MAHIQFSINEYDIKYSKFSLKYIHTNEVKYKSLNISTFNNLVQGFTKP